MSPQYDNSNSGALFKNENKKTDAHPEYKGSAEIGGTHYFVSAWIKTSKAGQKYMSLAFTAKSAMPVVKQLHTLADFNDEVGF